MSRWSVVVSIAVQASDFGQGAAFLLADATILSSCSHTLIGTESFSGKMSQSLFYVYLQKLA